VVLVTSRDSLAGLVAVHGAHRIGLDLLPRDDAIALLRRLIGNRVDTEPDAVAALIEQCARLPLALRVAAELAISRPTAPLADLVAELADQQRRLHLLTADGDPRAAVTSVFSWSVRHLPPDAADTFAVLGLHPGPDFDAYAAAALTGTGLDHARHALDVLAGAHLIHSTGRGRFGMHDLLRAYATSLAADRARAALGRLFDYHLGTAATAMHTLYPAEAHHRPSISPPNTPVPALADADTARAWLDTERPGLVATAAHTAAFGWPTHTIRLSTVLHRYLDAGHYTDALTIHTHAHHAAQQAGDPMGQAHSLLALGTTHRQLGGYGPAAEHLRQALTLFQQTGDQAGQARALGNLGIIERQLGAYEAATDHLGNAMALYRQAGDQAGQARALNSLGILEQQLGRHRPAAEHLQQALALFRQAGDQDGQARALNALGLLGQQLGHHDVAADHLRESLALYRVLGNRVGEASALEGLGVVHIRFGQTEQATALLRQALALFRESGDQEGEVWALNGLGEAAHAAGHPADARTHHTAALGTATQLGARDQQARAHTGLGHVDRALFNLDAARAHYTSALTLYNHLGMPDADTVRTHLDALDPTHPSHPGLPPH
jgi:tetratricopeptide (TPR) repeat protein